MWAAMVVQLLPYCATRDDSLAPSSLLQRVLVIREALLVELSSAEPSSEEASDLALEVEEFPSSHELLGATYFFEVDWADPCASLSLFRLVLVEATSDNVLLGAGEFLESRETDFLEREPAGLP